jgi:undecaprenyl-diphosphatase
MSIFIAVLLGLVQGLTEFLPVLVHCATVMSTIFVFRNEIWKLIQGFFKFEMNDETQYIFKICVSMIPVLIVGLFFKEHVEALFTKPLLVGFALLVTAILLSFAHFVKFKQQKDISYLGAFIIGVSQAIAVIPGLSRSGATISTGLLLGNKREDVARFSFLMVLVPILGATFLDIIGGEFEPEKSGISIPAMITGFLAAFISGLFACKVMIAIVKRSKLVYFAMYCAIVSIAVIVWQLVL